MTAYTGVDKRTSRSPSKRRPAAAAERAAEGAKKAKPTSAATSSVNKSLLAWAAAALIAAAAYQMTFLSDFIMWMRRGLNPFPLLDAIHAVAVAYEYRGLADKEQSLPQRIIAVCITSLGGTSMGAVILGTPFGWASDNWTLPMYIIAPLIMELAPGDVVYKCLSIQPVNFLLTLLDDITWGAAITAWGMEHALSHKAQTVNAILVGTLAGCGGGLMQATFSLLKADWKVTTPAAFTTAKAYSFTGPNASFACCVLIYLLQDPHKLLASYGLMLWTPLTQDEGVFAAVCVMCSVATVRGALEKSMPHFH